MFWVFPPKMPSLEVDDMLTQDHKTGLVQKSTFQLSWIWWIWWFGSPDEMLRQDRMFCNELLSKFVETSYFQPELLSKFVETGYFQPELFPKFVEPGCFQPGLAK